MTFLPRANTSAWARFSCPVLGGGVLVLGWRLCFPTMCDQQRTSRDTCLTSREYVTRGNNCDMSTALCSHCVRKSMLWLCVKFPQKWMKQKPGRLQEVICRKTSQTSHTQHLVQPTPPQNLKTAETCAGHWRNTYNHHGHDHNCHRLTVNISVLEFSFVLCLLLTLGGRYTAELHAILEISNAQPCQATKTKDTNSYVHVLIF